MKSKKLIVLIVVLVVVVLVSLIVKISIVDVKRSVSPYSETRSYLCPNTIDDGRVSDIEVGFYKNNSLIFLYPDTYIPPQHHASGDLLQVSDRSSVKTYKKNGTELVIDGLTATLKENGNIILNKCEQKMPGV